jgi:hypothetical protein
MDGKAFGTRRKPLSVMLLRAPSSPLRLKFFFVIKEEEKRGIHREKRNPGVFFLPFFFAFAVKFLFV